MTDGKSRIEIFRNESNKINKKDFSDIPKKTLNFLDGNSTDSSDNEWSLPLLPRPKRKRMSQLDSFNMSSIPSLRDISGYNIGSSDEGCGANGPARKRAKNGLPESLLPPIVTSTYFDQFANINGYLSSDDDVWKECDKETTRRRLIHPALKDISNTQNEDDVIDILHMFVDQGSLVGDGSRMHRLPTIRGRHQDLVTISTDTVASVLAGKFDDVIERYQIIDCRYPYEYEGGHIQGAINMSSQEDILDFVKDAHIPRHHGDDSTESVVLIFHCEFSIQRGPTQCRFLRSQDRTLNKSDYPALCFPEIYIMQGGYQKFHSRYREYCEPESYVPMMDKKYTAELRHFRSKSKRGSVAKKRRKIKPDSQTWS